MRRQEMRKLLHAARHRLRLLEAPRRAATCASLIRAEASLRAASTSAWADSRASARTDSASWRADSAFGACDLDELLRALLRSRDNRLDLLRRQLGGPGGARRRIRSGRHSCGCSDSWQSDRHSRADAELFMSDAPFTFPDAHAAHRGRLGCAEHGRDSSPGFGRSRISCEARASTRSRPSRYEPFPLPPPAGDRGTVALR